QQFYLVYSLKCCCMKRTIALARCGILLIFFLSITTFAFSQNNFRVSGKVTDDTGKPVSGATVQVKGTTIATATTTDGTFALSIPSGKSVLIITSVGLAEQEIEVNDRTEIVIAMSMGIVTSLQDVVVIGYGTQKKKNVTAAVSNFNASNLDERPVLRLDQAMVGQMAGVTVKQTSGALGRGISVQVRGTGSITAGNEPLYVVDGFPLATAAPNVSGGFSLGNPLDNINPNDIESVQVLKDAAAASIYGSRAANGVVIITTKKGKSGKVKVDFNTYVGYMEANRKMDMLSADEWVDRSKEIINAQWEASGAGRTASQ